MAMGDIQKLLEDAVAIVEAAAVEWAVMGGCARNAYAEPRATRDVDLVVAVDPAHFATLEHELQARGFKRGSTVGDASEPIPDLVLYRDANGRRLDILFAHTAFERSALARRKTLTPFASVRAHVVSAEDLLVYKLIADRPQDRADIAAVVEAQAARGIAIDWAYVERWCEAWDVGERLERLRSTLGA
jgi:predicted nucleotidyltransferase